MSPWHCATLPMSAPENVDAWPRLKRRYNAARKSGAGLPGRQGELPMSDSADDSAAQSMPDLLEQVATSRRIGSELRAAGVEHGVWHLSRAGYTVQRIECASDSELLEIVSIGPKVLAKVRAVIPYKPQKEVTGVDGMTPELLTELGAEVRKLTEQLQRMSSWLSLESRVARLERLLSDEQRCANSG
jgi:hypothetical protein